MKRNTIDELTSLLVKHNLMSHLIKIENILSIQLAEGEAEDE